MHKSWKIPKDKFERDAKSAGHRHNRLEDQVRHTRRGQQHSRTPSKIARRRPQNSRLPQGVGMRSWGRLQRPGGWSRSVLSSQGGLFKFEAVRKIRDLAMSEHSIELEQLASRVASAMYVEVSNGDDPFAEVKGIDQRHDREVGRKGDGGCQPEGVLRQGVLGELRQEGEQIGPARETQFFNRQKVCAAQKGGCRIAASTERARSLASCNDEA